MARGSTKQGGEKAVYGLLDNGKVRYVGASSEPHERYIEHLMSKSPETKDWINDLKKTGKIPSLKILKERNIDWSQNEVEQIHKYNKDCFLNKGNSPKEEFTKDYWSKKLVAKNLRKARFEAKLTRSEVASELNTYESTICRWETAVRTPNVSQMYSLAELYKTEPSSFFPSQEIITEAINILKEDNGNDD